MVGEPNAPDVTQLPGDDEPAMVRRTSAIGAAVVLAVVGFGVGIGIGGTGEPKPDNEFSTLTITQTETVTAAPTPAGPSPTTPVPPSVDPVPSDFEVDIEITDKQCIGDATTGSCQYQFRLVPRYIGTGTLPDKTTLVCTVPAPGGVGYSGSLTIDSNGNLIPDDADNTGFVSVYQNTELTATVTEIL
ncbi:MAG: hypothetical protein ACSLE6_08610 [Mycobacterium sp.]